MKNTFFLVIILSIFIVVAMEGARAKPPNLEEPKEIDGFFRTENGSLFTGLLTKETLHQYSETPIKSELREGTQLIWLSKKKHVKIYSISYKAGKKHGDFLGWNSQTGELSSMGQYNKGQNEGPFVRYNKMGVVTSISNYQDGKLNGQNVLFHPNGKPKSAGLYSNNKKIGVWYYWQENGIKLETVNYQK